MLIFISSHDIFSQPEWIKKVPPGYLNDYFVGSGVSNKSKADAKQVAFENAIISIMRYGILTIKYAEEDKITSTQNVFDDKSQLEIVRKSAQELKSEGESRTIKNLKEVESYYEENGARTEAWVLLSLPKKSPVTPPSAISPIWRSLLLPGWGQLYKEETFKGVSFMVLALGGVAGGLAFRQLEMDAINKAFSSHTQARRDFYNNESKNFSTYSTISFISAGVFYALSLMDAIIVKQDNLYVQIESDSQTANISFCFKF